MGRLIPAGTGMPRYRYIGIRIEGAERQRSERVPSSRAARPAARAGVAGGDRSRQLVRRTRSGGCRAGAIGASRLPSAIDRLRSRFRHLRRGFRPRPSHCGSRRSSRKSRTEPLTDRAPPGPRSDRGTPASWHPSTGLIAAEPATTPPISESSCGIGRVGRRQTQSCMPTIQQLVRQGRAQQAKKIKSPDHAAVPAEARRLHPRVDETPKKPNSALRKVARVRLTNGTRGHGLHPAAKATTCRSTRWC